MKISNSSPVASQTGHSINSGLVFYTRKGRQVARGLIKPANPKTPDQLTMRNITAAVSASWNAIGDPALYAGWAAFAARYYPQSGAFHTFMKLNVMRRILGQPIIPDAPTLGPPLPLTKVSLIPGTNPTQQTFNIRHTNASITGLAIVAEETPQQRSGRTPRSTELMYICGISPGSAVPLVTSGASITLTPSKPQLTPHVNNRAFGARLTVIRVADGQRSSPFYGTFTDTIT